MPMFPLAFPPTHKHGLLLFSTLSPTPNRLSALANTSWSDASASEPLASIRAPKIAARRNVMPPPLFWPTLGTGPMAGDLLIGVCPSGVRSERTMYDPVGDRLCDGGHVAAGRRRGRSPPRPARPAAPPSSPTGSRPPPGHI